VLVHVEEGSSPGRGNVAFLLALVAVCGSYDERCIVFARAYNLLE
jgi:hypothetical protein